MASSEGFLTDEQRELLKQNAEILSSSPKSTSSLLLPEHHIKVVTGGKAPTVGFAVRHVRRSHSGKLIRVKKGPSAMTGRTARKVLISAGLIHIQVLGHIIGIMAYLAKRHAWNGNFSIKAV